MADVVEWIAKQEGVDSIFHYLDNYLQSRIPSLSHERESSVTNNLIMIETSPYLSADTIIVKYDHVPHVHYLLLLFLSEWQTMPNKKKQNYFSKLGFINVRTK